jgi:hypothetical protein
MITIEDYGDVVGQAIHAREPAKGVPRYPTRTQYLKISQQQYYFASNTILRWKANILPALLITVPFFLLLLLLRRAWVSMFEVLRVSDSKQAVTRRKFAIKRVPKQILPKHGVSKKATPKLKLACLP